MLDQISFQAEAFIAKFPVEAARCNGRIERAIQIAQAGAVTRTSDTTYTVQSSSHETTYTVDTARKFCTCKDAQTGHTCKHRLAVAFAHSLVVPEERQVLAGDLPYHGQLIPVFIDHIYDYCNRKFAYIYTCNGCTPFVEWHHAGASSESTARYPIDLIKNIHIEEVKS